MDTICLVGHGQSMTGSGRGERIDQYPVARMKKCYLLMEQYPEDYGKRTDFAGGTTAAIQDVIRGFPDAKEYWAYIKSKYPDQGHRADNVKEGTYNGKQVLIPKELHFEWLNCYYDFRGTDEIRFSTGTGLILIALHCHNVKKLILAGFDSITDPINSEFQSVDWSPNLPRRDYDWVNDPPHDYEAEHYFLYDYILPAYEAEVEVMS